MVITNFTLPPLDAVTLSGEPALFGPVVLIASSPLALPTVARWEKLIRGSFPRIPVQRAFLVAGWTASHVESLRAATSPSAADSTLVVSEGTIDLRGADVLVALTELGLAVLGPPTDSTLEFVEAELSKR